jgi:hypothetical protein
MLTTTKTLSGLMGLCIGDALGVPVEFTSRAERIASPVTSMQGYGTWDMPPGTWSDDSSLTFCLAECLCNGFSLDAIANSFWRWYHESYWTAHGEVFDIGNTTFLVSVQFVTRIFGRHTNKCYQVNARSAVGKDSGKTCYIERFNNTVRQRVARLVRKTLSFSKSIDNHIGAVWYFVHHYNASLRQ